MPVVIVSAAVVFIALCVAFDLRSRRIPNALSLAGILVGVGLNLANAGLPGGLQSAAGFGVAIVLLLPAFAVGGIGGGDVKMMGALGAMLGTRLLVAGLICGMMAGGIFMLVHLWRMGRMREKLDATRGMVVAAVSGRSIDPLRNPARDPEAITLPYSVPLGLGVLLTLSVHLISGN